MKTLVILLISFLAMKDVVTYDKANVTRKDMSSAGDCIRSKWKSLLNLYDITRDGKISTAHFEQARKAFTELNKLSGEEKKLSEEMLTRYWKDCIFWSKQEVLEKDYGVLQCKVFLEERNDFFEKVEKCEALYLDVANTDHDEYISEKEGIIYLMALGLTDVETDEDFFKYFVPEDKGLPGNDTVSYWVKYRTDDNCSSDEIVGEFSKCIE